MQNSKVSVEGEAAHFSSVSDNNPLTRQCRTMESLKIYGSWITVNLEFLCSVVDGFMRIQGYAKTKWALL